MYDLISVVIAVVSLPIAFFSMPNDKREKIYYLLRIRRKPVTQGHFLDHIVSKNIETVSAVLDNYELEELWSIDSKHYGDFNLPLDTLKSWWRAFPDGLVVIRDENGKIHGGMGYWPVPQDWIDGISETCSPEDSIDENLIKGTITANRSHSWYISGIVIDDPDRNFFAKKHIAKMILFAFSHIAHQKSGRSTMIYSMPISEPGAKLLRRFDFRQLPNIKCEPPLYFRKYDRGLIHSLLPASETA